jgi:transcriptional regulator with XRE-family HTH domain
MFSGGTEGVQLTHGHQKKPINLENLLRQGRTKRVLSQAMAARKLGIKQPTLSLIESLSSEKRPGKSLLLKMCALYKIDKENALSAYLRPRETDSDLDSIETALVWAFRRSDIAKLAKLISNHIGSED